MLLLLYLALFGKHRAPVAVVLPLVLFEIIVVNTSIALNGAASNPFSSVLLVPLILGLILLSTRLGLVVLLVSLAAQGMQLLAPISDHHGAMMQNHAQGMIVSFMATSCLIFAVIHFYKHQLKIKQADIQQLRERQLRDEQLLAIGTAAAQLTHDAATPVQTIHLLLEEWQEQKDASTLPELIEQFTLLQTMLTNWRDVADDVRESRVSAVSIRTLLETMQHVVRLSRPEIAVDWPLMENVPESATVNADPTLVPALASIVINACDAAGKHEDNKVTVHSECAGSNWLLRINNPYDGTTPLHSNLGARILESETGLGLGAVLSNATVEKFKGNVHWQCESSQIITTIQLPVTI